MSPISSTVVLITGANSGVGYATAKVIAASSSDYHVVLAGRSLENVQAAEENLRAAHVEGSISSVQLDITDESSIKAAVDYIQHHYGRLDILVNNAAIYSQDPNLKINLQDTFSANVIGTAVVTEAFRPMLTKSKNAYLLFISSGLGSLAFADDDSRMDYNITATTYRMSKAALNMLTIQTAKALGKEGVKVFAICPGLVTSNLRGKSEEARSAGGNAGDPEVSGRLVLDIMEGKRDADVGKFVWTGGLYPW